MTGGERKRLGGARAWATAVAVALGLMLFAAPLRADPINGQITVTTDGKSTEAIEKIAVLR